MVWQHGSLPLTLTLTLTLTPTLTLTLTLILTLWPGGVVLSSAIGRTHRPRGHRGKDCIQLTYRSLQGQKWSMTLTIKGNISCFVLVRMHSAHLGVINGQRHLP